MQEKWSAGTERELATYVSMYPRLNPLGQHDSQAGTLSLFVMEINSSWASPKVQSVLKYGNTYLYIQTLYIDTVVTSQ